MQELLFGDVLGREGTLIRFFSDEVHGLEACLKTHSTEQLNLQHSFHAGAEAPVPRGFAEEQA